MNTRKKFGQTTVEYLVILGVVVAATLAAFAVFIPKISGDDTGYASVYFKNIVKRIMCSPSQTSGMCQY